MTEPTPRRVEWAGPEGWTVWADEDGCHIRAASSAALEHADVDRLFTLWQQCCQMFGSGEVPAPRPLTRAESLTADHHRRERNAARRAVCAVKREFDDVTPF